MDKYRTKTNSDAVALWSFVGIIIVFLAHIWMDFVWLGTVSFFASKSSRFISDKNYKILMIVLSAVLVYFGVIFLARDNTGTMIKKISCQSNRNIK